MDQKGQESGLLAIGGLIWGGIGVLFALLDLADAVKLGLISNSAMQCAQAGNTACITSGIQTMILFAVDVMVGPILLAANIMTNPPFGLTIIGVVIGCAILYFTFGRR